MAPLPQQSDETMIELGLQRAAAIDSILGAPSGELRLERAILRIASLFHRPASKLALDRLLAAPAIDGLTDEIAEQLIQAPPNLLTRLLSWSSGPASSAATTTIVTREEADQTWLAAVEHLRELSLLEPETDANPGGINTSEAIREYVADSFRRSSPTGWREGHSRLFNFYPMLLATPHPRSLAEMEPLYAAIVHGCTAGLHQEAFDRVYVDRMLQHHALFLIKGHAAYDAWLEILRHFFAERWIKPVANLNSDSQQKALAQAGFALRGAGKLRDAMKPIRAAIQLAIAQENWLEASAESQNLSEILSTLGDLDECLIVARDCVTYAERTQNFLRRLSARARLGDALHQQGELRLAARNFRRAERWQRHSRKDLPILISLRHYNYSDLLLALGRHDEVRVRGLWTLEVSREFQGMGMGPLDIALDKLTIARAAHAQWRAAQGLQTIPAQPLTRDEDGDPDAKPGDEDNTMRDTLPPSVPSIYVIKRQAIEENRNHTDHFDCAIRAFDQAIDELREERQLQYLPAALIARAAFRRDCEDYAAATADLDEAQQISEANEMRLYLADIALDRIRLALAEDPKLSSETIRTEINAQWLRARELIQTCGYRRRASELEDLRQILKAVPPLD